MGRSRYQIVEPDAPHFLTFTVLEWLPVFTRPETAQVILDAFSFRQQDAGFRLYGYVILENHLHCIVQSPELAKQIRQFKSFTARKIIDYLQERRVTQLLAKLAYYKKAHKTDREYQFWQEGSHPQWIQNEAMLMEKLQYIHDNPVKRGYVDKPEHWRYSSARNYLGGRCFDICLYAVVEPWVRKHDSPQRGTAAFPRGAWERENGHLACPNIGVRFLFGGISTIWTGNVFR